MKSPTLIALSLKLFISWQVPTKLAMLAEHLSATFSVMSNALNHIVVIHNTSKGSPSQK